MCCLIFFISWPKNCSGPCVLQKKKKKKKKNQDNTNKQQTNKLCNRQPDSISTENRGKKMSLLEKTNIIRYLWFENFCTAKTLF